MSTLDLSKPPPNHQYKVSVEPEETGWEQAVRLFKDISLFVAALVVVGFLLWFSYNTLISSSATAEEKKWAMSLLSGAAAGLIGYLIKK